MLTAEIPCGSHTGLQRKNVERLEKERTLGQRGECQTSCWGTEAEFQGDAVLASIEQFSDLL